jgi:uncharacterized protein (DUF983 family)
MVSHKLSRAISRGLRLKCPECGLGSLFTSMFRMREHCPVCGLRFVREQGYFIGAIYLNVIATESLIFGAFLISMLAHAINEKATYAVLITLAVILPVLFSRHARSLWLCFDHLIDPVTPDANQRSLEEDLLPSRRPF